MNLFATLIAFALLALIAYVLFRPIDFTPKAKFLDGGALIIGLIAAGLIGGLVYEKKVHDMKQLNQVSAFVDHQMCNRLKVPCTNYVPKDTDIRGGNGGWIDNAGKKTWPAN